MHLIKIGILTAALVSSFSVSATRYEVACIGGGPDYFGKYQLSRANPSHSVTPQ